MGPSKTKLGVTPTERVRLQEWTRRRSTASALRVRIVLACVGGRDNTARTIQYVDLTVANVERSIAFYVHLLGPLGFVEDARYQNYRGSEEIVYFRFAQQYPGLPPADGVEH